MITYVAQLSCEWSCPSKKSFSVAHCIVVFASSPCLELILIRFTCQYWRGRGEGVSVMAEVLNTRAQYLPQVSTVIIVWPTKTKQRTHAAWWGAFGYPCVLLSVGQLISLPSNTQVCGLLDWIDLLFKYWSCSMMIILGRPKNSYRYRLHEFLVFLKIIIHTVHTPYP